MCPLRSNLSDLPTCDLCDGHAGIGSCMEIHVVAAHASCDAELQVLGSLDTLLGQVCTSPAGYSDTGPAWAEAASKAKVASVLLDQAPQGPFLEARSAPAACARGLQHVHQGSASSPGTRSQPLTLTGWVKGGRDEDGGVLQMLVQLIAVALLGISHNVLMTLHHKPLLLSLASRTQLTTEHSRLQRFDTWTSQPQECNPVKQSPSNDRQFPCYANGR